MWIRKFVIYFHLLTINCKRYAKNLPPISNCFYYHFSVNSVLSLLVALSVAVCVSAGSYGGGQYLNYQQYVRPAYTQMQYHQPAYLQTSYVQPSYVGYGNTGSGLNLFNGSDAGSIIPIVIICTSTFLLSF